MIPTPKDVSCDPELFSLTFIKVLDKSKRLIPLQWNKMQRHFHHNRTGRDLLLKARQLGASTYVQAEMYRRTVTSTRTTMTLAHDDETTQKLRRMADRFWANCTFNGIQPARKYANAGLTTYPEFDSESIISKAGSLAAGRGGTYTDVHGSEVAFWSDAESILSGAMQGGSPDVVLESTPNGAQGFFYDRCMEALDNDGVWKLHFYPWWWDDAYMILLDPDEEFIITDEERELCQKHGLTPAQIKWRRFKQKELPHTFIQEYPEDPVTCFLTSGNKYFGDLSDVFTAPEGAAYQEGHHYTAGLDWGQENDYTVLDVFDMDTRCQVDTMRVNKLSWAGIRERVKKVYDRWNLRFILAEQNSIGGVNIEALQDMKVSVIPFDTNNESKSLIMDDLYEAIHNGFKLLPDQAHRTEFYNFTSVQLPGGKWRLAADGNGHDDTVIAAALAYKASTMRLELPDQPASKSKWKETSGGEWKPIERY